MNIQVSVAAATKYSGRCLVVGCYQDEVVQPAPIEELDRPLGGLFALLDTQGEFKGKLNRTKLIYTLGRLPTERILLVGLGRRSELTSERLRQAAGTAAQAVRAAGLSAAATVLHLASEEVEGAFAAVVEGFILGGYSFARYRKNAKDETPLEEVAFLIPDASELTAYERLCEQARIVCESVIFARDLVSQPANVANPMYLAEEAQDMAGACGVTCTVMEREEMERLGMDAILAVAKGSHQPPKFVILEYSPKLGETPVVLVGKGVTFDSGGISLKPREGMEKMKNDMAGAAAVFATVRAISLLGLNVNVVGLVPVVENLPGGGAYKPGDMVVSMSGQSIEIVNTDAEGRLILCDALHFAKRYNPSVMIDVATLTGACVVALGAEATGLMGNDAALISALKKAGEATGERVWELPLWEEYGELMKSDIADIKNAGGPHAGAISAGWFLKQFAAEVPWAHLDIAGTAWEEKGRPYVPKGATGVAVRLLVEFLRAR